MKEDFLCYSTFFFFSSGEFIVGTLLKNVTTIDYAYDILAAPFAVSYKDNIIDCVKDFKHISHSFWIIIFIYIDSLIQIVRHRVI